MPSILTYPVLEKLVGMVNTPEDIDLIVSRFDANSKDSTLFFQGLSEAGKDDILNEYAAIVEGEEE